MSAMSNETRKMHLNGRTHLNRRETLTVGSMLFGLFFGAGNLIFPVSMGQMAGKAALPAAIGFCVTGVGLPLLGILAMALSESDGLFELAGKVNKRFAYFFTLALYLTIGPLFAIPRTATVSFQVGVRPLIADGNAALARFIFSALFFAVVLFFSLRPSGILTWVGKILNPAFLLLLAGLIGAAFIHPMGSVNASLPEGAYAVHPLAQGFLDGYNTMDALASLAFGIVLVDVIRKLGVKKPEAVSASAAKSGMISTVLMAVIYISLAVVGSQSVSVTGISPDGGTALFEIARHYFGFSGGIFLGVMITIACAKTAIGLVTAIAETFTGLLPRALSYRGWAVLFSVLSFAIANVGLNAIIAVSIPVLMFLYPLTIVLITLCLAEKALHLTHTAFTVTMTTVICAAFLDLLAALPASSIGRIPALSGLIDIYHLLPLSATGMAWVLPTIIALVIGQLAGLSTAGHSAGSPALAKRSGSHAA